jgi:CRISPR-associated protein Cmr4
MKTAPYLLHALSPLHAGTGQSVGVIDLPIARMRATGIPYVPGSTIKGVLRDVRRRDPIEASLEEVIFGPWREVRGPEGDTQAIDEHAGALMVGDARLLAMPVRSFRGTFALVTCPLLLRLAARDLAAGGHGAMPAPRPFSSPAARVRGVERSPLVLQEPAPRVYLEDIDLDAQPADGALEAWAAVLERSFAADDWGILCDRLALVDDETMTFLWETATQVDTRVRISRETGVVEDGALWSEESLPPETLLIGLMAAEDSFKRDRTLKAEDVLARALPNPAETLQLGGKATVGRGRCCIRRVAEVRA